MSSSRFAIAIHVLSLLANSDDKPLNSEYLACSVNTNPVVIRRLLCALSVVNLVASQSGASGGTKLLKSPSSITLLDVYRAVEEDKQVFSLHRKGPGADCSVGKNVQFVLEHIQSELDDVISKKLGTITLSDVVHMIDDVDSQKVVWQKCENAKRKYENTSKG